MCIYIYIINVSMYYIYIHVHAHTKYCRCILHIWIETNLPWQSVAVLPGSGTKTSLKPATKMAHGNSIECVCAADVVFV